MEKKSNPEETIRLTPEQMEAVRLAEEAYERGESLTTDQVREMARKQTDKWIKTPRNNSA